MPLLNDKNMKNHRIGGSNYGFSGTRIGGLGACEYTLVVLAADVSGSVHGFKKEIEKCVGEIVNACRKSPRADNLMLRLTAFDNRLEEIHGFKLLSNCNPKDYRGVLRTGGATALYDAAYNAAASATQYGKDLADNDFDCNAIVFVITDGDDNSSSLTAKNVKEALSRAVTDEALESVVSILIGVNVQDPAMARYLLDFSGRAGFTQYVEIEKADAKTLARLAEFVSRSVSAQSQALGTGGPSRSLTF